MSDASTAIARAMEFAIQRHQAGDLAAAEALYAKILSAMPQHLGALHNLSMIWTARGDVAAAVALLSEGVRLAPADARLLYARAVALQNAGRHEEAIADYRGALQVAPGNHMAWENLGVALQDLGRHDEAAAAYRRALALQADSKIAWRNLGNVLRAVGDSEQGLAIYDEALRHHPADGDLHLLRATTLLTLGRLQEGWQAYEWRDLAPEYRRENPPRRVPLPKWDGRPLDDAAILLVGEQGIGDEIMFASCVPDIAARAGKTYLECNPRLGALFARSFVNVHVIARRAESDYGWLSDPAHKISWRLPTPSLPAFFRNDEESFGDGASFLHADAAQVAAWHRKLAALGPGLKVGISWRGGAEARARASRSIPLEQWQVLLAVEGAHFVSLQYGDHRAEIDAFNETHGGRLQVFDDIDPLRDMDGLAAAMAALDLVISVDNSTVHLAGALGVPTWVLLPHHADYRWMTHRGDSPWYASVRLLRLEPASRPDWEPLLARIAHELTTQRRRTPDPLSAQVAPDSTPRPRAPALAALPPARVADVLAPSSPPSARRALLLNDTSYWYHWGCSGTSLAIHAELRARGCAVRALPAASVQVAPAGDEAAFDDADIFAKFVHDHAGIAAAIEAADLVVINGEGTLHGVSPGALGLLYLGYLAKTRFDKPVHVINHSCYPPGEEAARRLYAKAYRTFDFIAVREPVSLQAVRALGVAPTASFDCLPLFIDAHPPATEKGDTLLLAGSVAWSPAMIEALAQVARWARAAGLAVQVLIGANAFLAADDVSFVKALRARLGADFQLVVAHSESAWLDAIARARLLISGRFHHSIAAAFLDTPFLLGDSNTAKVDGLLQMLELPRAQIRSAPDKTMIEQAGALLARPDPCLVKQEVRQRLLALGRANFAGL